MDIDNITDIELLRNLARIGRVKMLRHVTLKDGGNFCTKDNDFVFEKDKYYLYNTDFAVIRIFSESLDTYLEIDKEKCEDYFLFPCDTIKWR